MTAEPPTQESANGAPDADGPMLLAVDLAALRAFERPSTVVADAREWCLFVGIVGDEPDAVASFVRQYGLDQDFTLGEYESQTLLTGVKADVDAGRYVYLGTSASHRELAADVGWEFVHYEHAAARAEWEVRADVDPETDRSATATTPTSAPSTEAPTVTGRLVDRLVRWLR